MSLLIVFFGLSPALFALAVWTGAAAAIDAEAPLVDERAAFRQAVWPIFLGALVVAFLTGWALREPDPADERLSIEVFVLTAVGGALFFRALVRAVRGLVWSDEFYSIATVGLFKCRVVVSDAFRQAAAPQILEAALAHEAAHARHRDPLRIWLAQIACDLQWPFRGAKIRYDRWLLALEIRRDEEALAAGADGIELAESILLAARLQAHGGRGAMAGISGDGSGLAFRVRRLLFGSVSAASSIPERSTSQFAVILVLLAAVKLGATFGDSVLTILPGVTW